MHYFNDPIIDVFFDTMKKISDKYNLGLEDGLSLINNLENTEAIFITDNYELIYSDGLSE